MHVALRIGEWSSLPHRMELGNRWEVATNPSNNKSLVRSLSKAREMVYFLAYKRWRFQIRTFAGERNGTGLTS